MPTGSIREFALDTNRDYRTVYRHIEKGAFEYPDAELLEETKIIYRVRWKKTKSKDVKSK